MDTHFTITDISSNTKVGQPQILNLTVLKDGLNVRIELIAYKKAGERL